jgi:hypothetical protein
MGGLSVETFVGSLSGRGDAGRRRRETARIIA